MWKGALTDCLKNAAKHFNVGIDLYGPDLLAGEIPNQTNLPARTRTTSVNTIPAAQPAVNTNAIKDWTDFWTAVEAMGLPRGKDELKKAIGTDVLTYDPQFSFEQVQAWVHDHDTQAVLA